MKLELEFSHALCYAPKFIINDIIADSYDFGEQYDRAPEDADSYACGYMQFTRIDPTIDVLLKYKITSIEFEIIAGQLEIGLSFGNCGLCV